MVFLKIANFGFILKTYFMRKLKLQMNMTLDGFVGDVKGQLNWMLPEVDKKQIHYLHELTNSIDTIILGRVMATEGIPYWESVAKSKSKNEEVAYANFFVKTPKVIFSKTLKNFEGENTSIEKGNLKKAVTQLKSESGKDIMAYGGARFVSSLIEQNLIDELHLFVHPVAIGNGLPIFGKKSKFELVKSESYSNGIVLHLYKSIEK